MAKMFKEIIATTIVIVLVLGSLGVILHFAFAKDNAIPAPAPVPVDYTGKTLVTYGDSITWQGGWQDVVKDELHFEKVVNLGVNSSAMASFTIPDIDTYVLPMSSNFRINQIKNENPDVVTILAGCNDARYITSTSQYGTTAEFGKSLATKNRGTFVGAYSYLIETLLAWKPTLKIVIIAMWEWDMTLPIWEHVNMADANNAKPVLINALTKQIAGHYSLKCLDGNDLGINAQTRATMTQNADGVHIFGTPGVDTFADLVINGLKN